MAGASEPGLHALDVADGSTKRNINGRRKSFLLVVRAQRLGRGGGGDGWGVRRRKAKPPRQARSTTTRRRPPRTSSVVKASGSARPKRTPSDLIWMWRTTPLSLQGGMKTRGQEDCKKKKRVCAASRIPCRRQTAGGPLHVLERHGVRVARVVALSNQKGAVRAAFQQRLSTEAIEMGCVGWTARSAQTPLFPRPASLHAVPWPRHGSGGRRSTLMFSHPAARWRRRAWRASWTASAAAARAATPARPRRPRTRFAAAAAKAPGCWWTARWGPLAERCRSRRETACLQPPPFQARPQCTGRDGRGDGRQRDAMKKVGGDSAR